MCLQMCSCVFSTCCSAVSKLSVCDEKHYNLFIRLNGLMCAAGLCEEPNFEKKKKGTTEAGLALSHFTVDKEGSVCTCSGLEANSRTEI